MGAGDFMKQPKKKKTRGTIKKNCPSAFPASECNNDQSPCLLRKRWRGDGRGLVEGGFGEVDDVKELKGDEVSITGACVKPHV